MEIPDNFPVRGPYPAKDIRHNQETQKGQIMKREDVYLLIDGERGYQESMSLHSDKMQQANTPVAAWIIYMEKQLARARDRIYELDDRDALAFIRKCTAVGVACMEHNDTPAR